MPPSIHMKFNKVHIEILFVQFYIHSLIHLNIRYERKIFLFREEF